MKWMILISLLLVGCAAPPEREVYSADHLWYAWRMNRLAVAKPNDECRYGWRLAVMQGKDGDIWGCIDRTGWQFIPFDE